MYISEHIEKITTKNKKEILALALDSSKLLVKSQSCPIHPLYVNYSSFIIQCLQTYFCPEFALHFGSISLPLV